MGIRKEMNKNRKNRNKKMNDFLFLPFLLALLDLCIEKSKSMVSLLPEIKIMLMGF